MNDKYNNIQKAYRKKFLELIDKMEKDYGDKLDIAITRIRKLVTNYSSPDGTFSKAKLKIIKQELEGVSYWLTSEFKDLLDENIIKSAKLAGEGQDVATEYILSKLAEENSELGSIVANALQGNKVESVLIQVRFGGGLDNFADEIRKQIWRKRWEDGLTLTDRIWNLNNDIANDMKNIIQANVNQGESAVNFARQIEQYLKEPKSDWSLKNLYPKTNKSYVNYNAMRLARTETNQAYHEAQKIADKESIVVKGTKWNLSASHPSYPPSYSYNGYQEICDYRAKANHHDMGPGVYPAGETPLDHPNGLCYLTSVLYEKEELVSKLEEKYGGD